MVHGIVIPAAAEEPLKPRQLARLEDYQAAVGGWIEAVDVPTLGVTIYVNEEGLLRQLPFNSRVSFLWWHHVPGARQKAMLVGDAVLVGLPDRNGDSTDVPKEVIDTLMHPGHWRVEVRVADDSKWYRNQVTYRDYFDALVWAMVTLERWTMAQEVRVVAVDDEQDQIAPTPSSDPARKAPPAA
ncbi:DUF3846 domain-containing protein [Microbacterium sp. ASV49]|uniref:DUF3846 domain-containing protein n=1 Tax=Microbacterium candidum TaxID=3041922 RepID=A0ABT7N059_9MICO|nr:DUF3846 domain-containing protein [Microbacterium sp. ASV49]MDL9980081.1 DUF3846 domain-containing protein [Microbacterium sp. ASV49]